MKKARINTSATFRLRSKKMMWALEQELFEKLWYFRHMLARYKGEKLGPHSRERALAAEKRIRCQYGAKKLWPLDDFELGMLSGNLSAIRWALGDEMDNLDT